MSVKAYQPEPSAFMSRWEPFIVTIYFEGLALVAHHFSGVGRYVLGVLHGLDELIAEAIANNADVPDIRVLIPFDRLDRFRSFGFVHLRPKVIPLPMNLAEMILFADWFPPLDLFCGKGVYIFPSFLSSRLLYSPSLVVIHDLSFEYCREFVDDGTAQVLSDGVRKSVRRATKLVAVSENTRKEVINFYRVEPSQVVIVSPAADQSQFFRRGNEEIAKVKQRYGIEGDYILTLSNLEPRKNLGTLIDVYCGLSEEIRDKVGLLLVGSFGWKFENTMESILCRLEQGFNILRPTKYVADEDRPALLSGAAMLVYPSHYEGFGIPPLEALACGTPVITANNSSLPQVVGTAGRLVSCDQPPLLKQAIEQVYKNLEQETEEVGVSGPLQARKFCWKKSAQTLLDTAKELS